MKILIKNGHVICPKSNIDKITNILINDGIISEINEQINTEIINKTNMPQNDIKLIDATGKYVLPGLVDAHCHLRDPGYEYKEDIKTGSQSAAAGGFTSIACMPNTNPVTDNKTVVRYIINKAKEEAVVNVFPIGAITKDLKGDELSAIGSLKTAGVVALSDDGNPVKSASIMKKAMQYASMFNLPIISHCEDLELAEDGVINEGYYSTILGLKGIPSAAEEVMVARELVLAEYLNLPIHIAHVSTHLSVDLIRSAKKRGVKVTAETCPHYFSLTDEMCDGFNTLAKVNPPLRSQKDVEAIITGLKDGTIDIIATDHAPHHVDEKNVEFELAANGMVGFETAFPLAITYLVKNKHLSMKQLVDKMSRNPSEILRINKGTLEIGKEADVIIADINKEFDVEIQKFKSKNKNSPYNGFKLFGNVDYTIVKGNIVKEEM